MRFRTEKIGRPRQLRSGRRFVAGGRELWTRCPPDTASKNGQFLPMLSRGRRSIITRWDTSTVPRRLAPAHGRICASALHGQSMPRVFAVPRKWRTALNGQFVMTRSIRTTNRTSGAHMALRNSRENHPGRHARGAESTISVSNQRRRIGPTVTVRAPWSRHSKWL